MDFKETLSEFLIGKESINNRMKKAIVLLSGGLDSSTTLAIAKEEGYELYALTFLYGQTHRKEVESAKAIADFFEVKEHKILEIDMASIGGSSLTDESIEIPEERPYEVIGEGIPSTYVPARNIILLGFAVGWAEVVNAEAVLIGAHSVDYSGYPDCRPEFLQAFQKAVDVGTRAGVKGKGVKILYPLIRFSKAEIVIKGNELGVPFQLTWSCYKGGEKACGKCDSCKIRLKGFAEAGIQDPLDYEA